MKTKVSPTIVGAFVIGAFALGVIALLSFGSVSLFSKPQRFAVYFNETIHGLDLGSPVKLRGVRVGRVVSLNVQFDEVAKKSVVRVVCEFNRDIITDGQAEIDVTSREVLQELIDKGLRAQLGVMGLATGLLYVELDFRDPERFPDPMRITEIKYAVVPSTLSTISEFQANLTTIMAGMKDIDIGGIAKNLNGLITDARTQVNGLELGPMVAEWTKTAESLNEFTTSPELKITITNLNLAATELRAVLEKLDGQIDPTADKLGLALEESKTTLASFNAAVMTLRQFINAQHQLGAGANQAFVKLADAAESVERLADFLERNPQALLTGRKIPNK